MRILIINSEYPPVGGGAGNASANIACHLANLGQDIFVLTSAYNGLPQHEATNGLQILRIPTLRRRADRSSAFEQGVFILTASASAIRLIPQWKPDIIIAFFGIPGGAVALLARWLYKTPYLISLRGSDVPGFRPYDFGAYHKLLAPLLRLIWRRAAAIVANSSGLRQMALNFDCRFPISLIPNGVDLKRFVAPPGRSWNPPRLLFVGRLVYQKGLDLLLPALARLRHLAWELTIVGDGPQRTFLQKTASDLQIGDRVHFVGWKRGSELEKEYQVANLFVFPSRHEGMPNVVLEAMASGLPVLATRIAGNDELVLPGQTGELIPPEDISALEAALCRLLPDAGLRQQMGTAGRRQVEQKHTWDSIAHQYLYLLQSIQGKDECAASAA